MKKMNLGGKGRECKLIGTEGVLNTSARGVRGGGRGRGGEGEGEGKGQGKGQGQGQGKGEGHFTMSTYSNNPVSKVHVILFSSVHVYTFIAPQIYGHKIIACMYMCVRINQYPFVHQQGQRHVFAVGMHQEDM